MLMASVKFWENFDIIRVLLGIYMVNISCIFNNSLCCHNCYEIIFPPTGSAVKNPGLEDSMGSQAGNIHFHFSLPGTSNTSGLCNTRKVPPCHMLLGGALRLGFQIWVCLSHSEISLSVPEWESHGLKEAYSNSASMEELWDSHYLEPWGAGEAGAWTSLWTRPFLCTTCPL